MTVPAPKAPRPRLERRPGDVLGRRDHSRPNKLVAVLYDDGRWRVGTVLEQWRTDSGRWCLMLRYPLPEQVTTTTQPVYFDAACVREPPEDFDPRADIEPYLPEPPGRMSL